MQLLPSHDAVSLITVLPEQLQSPLLTAEWEYRLGEIERGQLAPEEFLDGISTMLRDLVGTYQVIKGTEYLFTPPREVNIINLRLDITHLYYPAKNSFQKSRLKRREIFTELLLYTLTT